MKRIRSIAVLLLAMLMAVSCSEGDNTESEVESIVLQGEDGKTVFDLLIKHHEVDYVKSDMGIFIKAIDEIENKSGHYWVYSINGKPGEIACDKAIVSDGDTIKWEYK